MRDDRGVVEFGESSREHWLVFEDIQPGTPDDLVSQGRDQRLFVDKRPTRRVDEYSGRFHRSQFGSANVVMRLGQKRQVQRQVVGFTQQGRLVDKSRVVLAFELRVGTRVRINDVHVECLGLARKPGTDPAKTSY